LQPLLSLGQMNAYQGLLDRPTYHGQIVTIEEESHRLNHLGL